MEIRKIIRTYEVDMQCDNCGVGQMRSNGTQLLSYPPKYPHVCNNCGYKENYSKSYPSIEYGE